MPRLLLALASTLMFTLGCGGGAQQATLDQLNKCNEDYRAFAERMAGRAPAAETASTSGPTIYEKAGPDVYVTAVEKAGFEIKARTDRFVQIEVYGLKVQLFPQETSAQLFAGFTASETMSPLMINDWNRTKRFSRAYIDKEGDPVLESDIDLEGGVTEAAIVTWIQTFAISLRAFNNMLFEATREPAL